jgi:lysine-specific demethylase 8
MPVEVERIRVKSLSELAERLEAGRAPLVIQGAIDHYPALATWSADSLSRRLGPVRVRYKLSPSNAHPDFRAGSLAQSFATGESRLDELLTAITSGDPRERSRRLLTGDEQFLLRRRDGVTRIHPELSPLLADVEIPPVIPEERLFSVWPWLSGPGVRTWLHYDNNGCHNLNAQICGRKQCLLLPPEHLDALALFPPGGPNPAVNCCAIDVDAPAPELADAFGALERHEAEIEAGDVLYIPAWWLHAFLHLGELNANVNFWWKPLHPTDNAVSRRQAGIDANARAT